MQREFGEQFTRDFSYASCVEPGDDLHVEVWRGKEHLRVRDKRQFGQRMADAGNVDRALA